MNVILGNVIGRFLPSFRLSALEATVPPTHLLDEAMRKKVFSLLLRVHAQQTYTLQ
jgi:hypothetical protein